jgi:hypothetical protein
VLWLDYTVRSFADGSFTVAGEWPGEVMGLDRDGNPGCKKYTLYQPGDVFIVDKEGVLRKQEDVTKMIYTYKANK